MKRTSLYLLAFFVSFSCLFCLPRTSLAIGQVTEPIDIKGAIRQTPYDELMTIVNTEKTAATIKLSAEGDIAGWVRFYKNTNDIDNNITDVSLESGERTEVYARFVVPAEIPNGTYKGYVSVLKMNSDYAGNEGNSGSSVAQKIDREATVEVSDVENIDFNASIIPESYDVSSGDILRIRIIYDNRSNVTITPQTAVKIRQGESVIYSAIFPYPDNQPQVRPYSLYEIPALEIPTSNLGTGGYDALLTISQGDKFSIDKDFGFSVGTVLSANTAAAAPPNQGSLDTVRWAMIILAGLALYVIFRMRFRRNKRFEGRVSIDSLSQK